LHHIYRPLLKIIYFFLRCKVDIFINFIISYCFVPKAQNFYSNKNKSNYFDKVALPWHIGHESGDPGHPPDAGVLPYLVAEATALGDGDDALRRALVPLGLCEAPRVGHAEALLHVADRLCLVGGQLGVVQREHEQMHQHDGAAREHHGRNQQVLIQVGHHAARHFPLLFVISFLTKTVCFY